MAGMFYLDLKEPLGEAALALIDGKTFQVHRMVTGGTGRVKLYAVEIEGGGPCPVRIHGGMCGLPAGHAGKHCWARGD